MPLRPRRGVFKVPVLAASALAMLAALTGCERPGTEEIARADGAIVGGKLDTTHKGVVSLLKQVQGGYYPACTGTLLTQNLVLTAHHCVAGLDSNDGSSVECGKTQFTQLEKASTMLISVEANVGDEGLDPFRVAQVWVPAGSNAVCGRDIALLLLSGAGVPAGVATPIEPNLSKQLADNEVFAAIGYGLQDPEDETGQTAGHRMGVSNATVYCEGNACGTDLVLEGEFVADSPVCSGDSGGPALDKNGRVSGVTSRGDEGCTVGIYSGVSAWKDFIVEKTLEAATSGHYTPPAWAGEPPPAGTGGGGSNSGGASNGGASKGGASSGGASSGGASNNGGASSTAGSSTAGSSALPLAGSPSSGGGVAGNSSGNTPVIDPLGLSCTGACPGSYVCWAASGKTTGTCVPTCGADDLTCPASYSCDTAQGACLKEPERDDGCSVAAANKPGETGGQAWLGLLLLGAFWRRRRPSAARLSQVAAIAVALR